MEPPTGTRAAVIPAAARM